MVNRRFDVPAARVAGYAIAKLVPGLITFASIPIWLTRFGVEAYGRYSIIWAVSTATGALAVGWIRQSVLRGTGDATWSITSLSGWVHTSWLLVSALPVLAVAVLLRPELPLAVASFCLGLASSAYTVAQAQVQRLERTSLYALADTGRVGLALLLTFVPATALGEGAGASILIGANALAYVLATGMLYLAVRTATENRFGLSRSRNRVDMWAFGAPLGLWLGVSFGLVYIDRFFLQVYRGSETVGQYSAIADLVGRGLPMIAFPVTMAVHPIVMRLWNAGDRAAALRTTIKATRSLFAVMLALVVIAFAAAPLVFRTLLPGVPVSRGLLIALIIGSALWQLALLVHKPLEFERRTNLMLLAVVSAAALTAALDLIFVPLFGATAAASSFAVGAATYCVVTYVAGRRLLRRSHADVLMTSDARTSLGSGSS